MPTLTPEQLAAAHREERARRFAEALVAFKAIISHDREDFMRIARALILGAPKVVEGREARFERKMAEYATELAAIIRETQGRKS